jgi:aspartate 1-decarboxylase
MGGPVFRGKLLGAAVTAADPLHYLECLSVDPVLMRKAGFRVGERVLVVSKRTGRTWEGSVARSRRANSGEVKTNSALTQLFRVGEKVDILAFDLRPLEARPWSDRKTRVVRLGEDNRILEPAP